MLDVLQSAKYFLAELLQAFIAYPSIQTDMKAAAKECHQQMQSQPRDVQISVRCVQSVFK